MPAILYLKRLDTSAVYITSIRYTRTNVFGIFAAKTYKFTFEALKQNDAYKNTFPPSNPRTQVNCEFPIKKGTFAKNNSGKSIW